MNIIQRLKTRWAFRGTPPSPSGTLAVPTQQTEELSADQKWAKEHGMPVATVPMPATAEIAAHNAAVEAEYQAEVSRRRDAYTRGGLRPRFFIEHNGFANFTVGIYDPQDVNWDLEMSILPGRRLDVTKDTGIVPLPIPSLNDVADTLTLDALHSKVETVKAAQAMTPEALLSSEAIMRQLVGDKETLLAACGGDEKLAAQVEEKALLLAEDIKKERRAVGIEPVESL